MTENFCRNCCVKTIEFQLFGTFSKNAKSNLTGDIFRRFWKSAKVKPWAWKNWPGRQVWWPARLRVNRPTSRTKITNQTIGWTNRHRVEIILRFNIKIKIYSLEKIFVQNLIFSENIRRAGKIISEKPSDVVIVGEFSFIFSLGKPVFRVILAPTIASLRLLLDDHVITSEWKISFV